MQYLIAVDCQPSRISAKNIVITQDMEVKFMDSCLLQCYEAERQKATCEQIYGELAEMVFGLIVGTPTKLKSWKSKLKMLERKVSKETHDFFVSIYRKSLANECDQRKTKKISKKAQGKASKIESVEGK